MAYNNSIFKSDKSRLLVQWQFDKSLENKGDGKVTISESDTVTSPLEDKDRKVVDLKGQVKMFTNPA